MKHPVFVFSVLAAALAGVTTSLHADGLQGRFIRLTVTASRPGVDGAPDYANRSWQICDLKLFGNGAEIPLKDAKVVSPSRRRADFTRSPRSSATVKTCPHDSTRSLTRSVPLRTTARLETPAPEHSTT